MIKKSESCSYCTPDGAQCTRAVDAEGTFCRWHSGLSSLSLPELEQMVAETWEKKMGKKCSLFFSAFIIAVISNLAVPVAAISDEGTCYLEATTDVYVVVYDLDREGNQGERLWQGRINQGDTVLLKAPHARFRYEYNFEPDKDQALSVGPDKWCDSNKNVGIP